MAPQDRKEAIIIGGSLGGVGSALALRKAGFNVTVFERATKEDTIGVGLSIYPKVFDIFGYWGLREKLEATQPLKMRYWDVAAYSTRTKELRPLIRALNPTGSAAWNAMHSILRGGLPEGPVNYRSRVTGFEEISDSKRIRVTVETRGNGDEPPAVSQHECDLLIAADGATSQTRAKLIGPDEKRRYGGMVAWRGLVSSKDYPEEVAALKQRYPDWEDLVTFEVAETPEGHGMHIVFLPVASPSGVGVNYSCYRTSPEPKLNGLSTAVKPTAEETAEFYAEVAATLSPELAAVIAKTDAPVVNAIYDKQPIKQWVFGRVALAGDAAHPMTPNTGRGTTTALSDAYALGRCFEAAGGDIDAALAAYQAKRIPASRREVLYARFMGELRSSFFSPPGSGFWENAGPEARAALRFALPVSEEEMDAYQNRDPATEKAVSWDTFFKQREEEVKEDFTWEP